jgi:hypothetical protein
MNGSELDLRPALMKVEELSSHYEDEDTRTVTADDQRGSTRSTPGIEMPGYEDEVLCGD